MLNNLGIYYKKIVNIILPTKLQFVTDHFYPLTAYELTCPHFQYEYFSGFLVKI